MRGLCLPCPEHPAQSPLPPGAAQTHPAGLAPIPVPLEAFPNRVSCLPPSLPWRPWSPTTSLWCKFACVGVNFCLSLERQSQEDKPVPTSLLTCAWCPAGPLSGGEFGLAQREVWPAPLTLGGDLCPLSEYPFREEVIHT